MKTDQLKNTIPISDAAKINPLVAEVIGFHLYHNPENEKEVNGFTYAVKLGGHHFTVAIREGLQEDGIEQTPAVALQTGSNTYKTLISGHHELLDSAQQHVIHATPAFLEILSNLKG